MKPIIIKVFSQEHVPIYEDFSGDKPGNTVLNHKGKDENCASALASDDDPQLLIRSGGEAVPAMNVPAEIMKIMLIA